MLWRCQNLDRSPLFTETITSAIKLPENCYSDPESDPENNRVLPVVAILSHVCLQSELPKISRRQILRSLSVATRSAHVRSGYISYYFPRQLNLPYVSF